MRLLAIAMGILLATLFLGAAELVFRAFGPFDTRGYYKLTGAEASAYGSAPTHIPIHPPPKRYRYPLPWAQQPPNSVHRFWENNYWNRDPDFGPYPNPNGMFSSSIQLPGGEKTFDVVYSIDAESRRITPGQEQWRPKNLLFFGCSFTYGDGVQNDQTLPARVSSLQSDYQVFNYSFHGWGPGNLLRLIKNARFAQDLAPKTGSKAIYVFIDNHLPRLIGTLSLFRSYPTWTRNLPHYELDKEGRLITFGMIHDTQPVLDWFFAILSKSEMLKYFKVDYPRPRPAHLRLLTEVIKEMREALHQKLGDIELIVLFYPGSKAAQYIIPLLDEAKISSLDYSRLNLASYLDKSPNNVDGHPSPEAYDFLARLVVNDLNLKK